MKLTWANEQRWAIRMELDEDEVLGASVGPIVAFVPLDESNADYAAILAHKLPIDDYDAEVSSLHRFSKDGVTRWPTRNRGG